MKDNSEEPRAAFLRLPPEQREAFRRLMPSAHRMGMSVDGAWQLHLAWPSAEALQAFLTMLENLEGRQ